MKSREIPREFELIAVQEKIIQGQPTLVSIESS